MLKKLKKAIPAVVSAILCASIALGITVCAQNVNSRWNECKKLINSHFNQNYIDLAIKYSGKECKNTIAFSKSRAKKFIGRLDAALTSDNSEFSLEMSDKNNFLFIAQKGNNLKQVLYEEGYYTSCDCEAIFSDGKTITAISLENKTKAETKANEADYILSLDSVSDELDFDQKGKIFKFKSGEKTYYYEEFEFADYNSFIGFLFDENGNILAMLSDEEAFYVSFKTKVDDSQFDIPKDYKNVDYNDFEF